VLKYDALYPDVNRVTVLANNHDTDRFMSLKGATKEGAKLHLAFILATRGIPQLYYGEEILMTGGHDPENRKDFPGGFPGDAADKSTPAGRTADEREMFEDIKKIIKIRKENDALKRGETIDLFYNEEIYVFARKLDKQVIIVGINNSEKDQTLEFEEKNLQLPNDKYLFSPSGIGKYVTGISLSSNINGKFPLRFPGKSAVFYRAYTIKEYEKRYQK
jgi:neopullulanase